MSNVKTIKKRTYDFLFDNYSNACLEPYIHVAICEIFAIEMRMTQTMTFGMGQGGWYTCKSNAHIGFPILWQC